MITISISSELKLIFLTINVFIWFCYSWENNQIAYLVLKNSEKNGLFTKATNLKGVILENNLTLF